MSEEIEGFTLVTDLIKTAIEADFPSVITDTEIAPKVDRREITQRQIHIQPEDHDIEEITLSMREHTFVYEIAIVTKISKKADKAECILFLDTLKKWFTDRYFDDKVRCNALTTPLICDWDEVQEKKVMTSVILVQLVGQEEM